MRTIIFSDLDGTLLDHHTYSFAPAVPVIKKCDAANIPVIPTTSKTFAELIPLREKLGLSGPFIVENGAAVYIPHGFFDKKPPNTLWQDGYWVHQLTSKKHYWSSLLKEEGREFEGEFHAFSDMSEEDICDATGLSIDEARLAAKRQYGEPVLWLSSEERKQLLIERLKVRGARPLQGGRFLHISGETDKGAALKWLVSLFEKFLPTEEFRSIALGDGQNDAAMLNAADISVLIKSPVNDFPTVTKKEDVYASTLCGPEGWAESLNQLLKTEFSSDALKHQGTD